MYGEPNWLASYLAKKITRRAFSVYRSNISPHPRCPQSPLPETSLSLPGTTSNHSGKKPFHPASASVTEAQPACRTKLPPAHFQQTSKPEPYCPRIANSAMRAGPPQPGRDAIAARDHSGGQTQGCG